MNAKKNKWKENFQRWKEGNLARGTGSRNLRYLKIFTICIPFMIVLYLVSANFLVSQEFEYFYDVGGGENYLTPVARISEIIEDGNHDYRNLTDGLVYFDVPIARGADKIEVQVRFKDSFPEGEGISLGAKDQEVWHYNYHFLYNPAFEELSRLSSYEGVYLVNTDLQMVNPEILRNRTNVVVATDKKYRAKENIVGGYVKKNTVIDATLRGAHTFYIYAEGNLKVSVKKQDINWYEGSDELEINLHDLDGKLISNMTIEDDGLTEKGDNGEIQSGVLEVDGLKEGIYKLEFSDADALIREIKINTNKIVSEKVFLADNEIYDVPAKTSRLYLESNRKGQLDMITYHSAGIQKISYRENDLLKKFNFGKEDEWIAFDLSKGVYEIDFPKNDLIVSGAYFAFFAENYFEPFSQRVVPLRGDFNWIRKNVDYIATDYSRPEREGDWLAASTSFDLDEENLYVSDNKLSLVFNTPHFSNENLKDYQIPIDWIKIKVYKPGAFER